eukprot:11476858-Prorocentrum_lima.AAC.1
MTSSLVGSEMCIRDSQKEAHKRPVVLGGLRHTHGGPAIANQTQRDAEAVSYTHLTLPTICSV